MKYLLKQNDGMWSLSEAQTLSQGGFERNLASWCTPTYDEPDLAKWAFPAGYGFMYNAAADVAREEWAQTIISEITARIAEREREAAAKELEYKLRAEHTEQIRVLAQGAKFKRAEFNIAATGKDGKKEQNVVKGYIFNGLGMHKTSTDKYGVYSITHLKSGLSFGLKFETAAETKIAIVRLSAIRGDFQPLTAAQVIKDKAIVALVKAMERPQRPGTNYSVYSDAWAMEKQ